MESWIGPALIAAVISSAVTVAGWWVAHFRDRRGEAARRAERIRDYQTALRAEIRSRRAQLASVRLEEHARDTVRKIEDGRAAGIPYLPFVPKSVESFMFEAVAQHIHVLPRDVIDPVVLYYRQVRSISLFAEELRSDRFRQIDSERQIAMYEDYIAMESYAVTLADDALDAIERSLSGKAGQ